MWPKSTGTRQYYTFIKPIIVFVAGLRWLKIFRQTLKRGATKFSYRPISCDISLERSAYEGNDFIQKKRLRHPWPKWWHVKVDELTKFDRMPFLTELTYTLVNCTIVFLFAYDFKQSIAPKRPKIKHLLRPHFWGQFWIFWGAPGF